MSHFSVAVIMDGSKSLEEILAPYEECTENKEFLEFCDTETEYSETYQNGSQKMVRMLEDQSLKSVWNKMFLVEISEGMYDLYRQDENIRLHSDWKDGKHIFYRYEYGVNEVVDVPYKELYATFEEYMKEEHGADERDPEKNRFGYWYNPNSKWDWWQVGGRWAGYLKAKTGRMGEPSLVYPRHVEPGHFDLAQIRDIDFSGDKVAYNKAIRYWEVVVEGAPLKDGETKEMFESFWKKEYYLNHYGTKEQYARELSEMSTFAVVTLDGKWHEKGQMGWFGCSSESGEESREWHNSWYDTFIKDENPEHVIVIVDCHI